MISFICDLSHAAGLVCTSDKLEAIGDTTSHEAGNGEGLYGTRWINNIRIRGDKIRNNNNNSNNNTVTKRKN